jgi:signal transduction histidine kinase
MRISIRTKLLGTFGFILLLVGITSLFAVFRIRDLKDSLTGILQNPMTVSRVSQDIEVSVLTMQQLMYDISISRDQKQHNKILGELGKIENNVMHGFTTIQQSTLSNEIKVMTLKSRILFLQWRPIRERIISLADSGDFSGARTISKNRGDNIVKSLQVAMEKISDLSARKAKDFTEETARMANSARLITIISLIVACVIGIFIALTLSLSITRRLNIISEATTNMSERKFGQVIRVVGTDELSRVAWNFNSMAIQLSDLYETLEKKVEDRTLELQSANLELQKVKNELEQKVAERTEDLESNIRELNKSHMAMLYMIEDLNKTSTQLKETQAELIRKERLAVLGQFSGNISHELRNPLGVIDSSIYFLQMRLKDADEKVLQHLDRISTSVKTSTSIIENLLDLSRMTKPVMEKYAVSPLLTEFIENSKPPESINILRNFPEEETEIMVEKEQFRMAIGNILKNAFAAMNENGTLEISIFKSNGNVVMSFKDSGQGIEANHINQVFQPLFSTKSKGIGLGLSITKMIIENHGGTIRVDSEPGKGANFIIEMPLLSVKDEPST